MRLFRAVFPDFVNYDGKAEQYPADYCADIREIEYREIDYPHVYEVNNASIIEQPVDKISGAAADYQCDSRDIRSALYPLSHKRDNQRDNNQRGYPVLPSIMLNAEPLLVQ